MSEHTTLGCSNVAGKWRKAYAACHVGDDVTKLFSLAGSPDSTLDLGGSILYTYESHEWKGYLRGGTIVRQMQFVVKNRKIISKTSKNLDKWAL